jgi:glycosyltransferase involved in cell wall biosynthesis
MRLTRVIAKLEPGGAQLGVLRISAALRAQGIRTRIIAGFATREGRRQFAAAGLAPEVWPDGAPGVQYETRLDFAEWLQPRLCDADIVHAHMFGGWSAAAHAVAPGTPLVASEHNALRWPVDPPAAELRAALLRVDLMFAHGPSTRALFADLGVGPDRLRSGASAIEGIDAKPRRGLPSPRIVFAGRLHKEKGPDLLIEALASLDQPPPALILGAGPMERGLRRLARRLRVDRAIRFCGWRPDAPRYIAGSSVCVVPSRHDAWSQTAVIAMGLGVPVVATAVEGLPATIGSSRGVLVAPDDPAALAEGIDRVLNGEMLMGREEARLYAQRYLPNRVAGAYADEYRRLLGDARVMIAAA